MEFSLAISAFIDGSSYVTYMAESFAFMQDMLKNKNGTLFDGVRLHTGANMMSKIRVHQYNSYTK